MWVQLRKLQNYHPTPFKDLLTCDLTLAAGPAAPERPSALTLKTSGDGSEHCISCFLPFPLMVGPHRRRAAVHAVGRRASACLPSLPEPSANKCTNKSAARSQRAAGWNPPPPHPPYMLLISLPAGATISGQTAAHFSAGYLP